MTNEKNRRLAPPGGNLFRFGLYFREKTEKRTGRDASNGKTRKFPSPRYGCRVRRARRRPRPSCPSCRRAVLPSCRRARRKGHPGADVSETTGQGRAERKIRRKPQPEAKASGCGLQTEKTPFQEKRGGFRRKIAQKGAQRIPAENPGKVTLSFYCRLCGCGFPNRNPRN